jgi:hypothetical protein
LQPRPTDAIRIGPEKAPGIDVVVGLATVVNVAGAVVAGMLDEEADFANGAGRIVAMRDALATSARKATRRPILSGQRFSLPAFSIFSCPSGRFGG